MSDRWRLSRAGIINVYQYGDETLHFAGGRLLLRGVNGSGKSTAMNMILPFLLDGDVRKIDAAGEQASVLRSWMLSGRDEQQPQGYLWLELANGDGHLTFGCGIRANRSTDKVNTWWFITDRRPGIDLHLVENRVPLGAEALRASIEPGTVYRDDQRAAYRHELRARLFAGADLDEHLHLLRIVRNPRVGDRLDADLPTYLEGALPQLSDAALDDASQPLEDLDEHRRTVADLERSNEALSAIEDVYRNYARCELHKVANHVLAEGAARDSRAKEEQRADRQHHRAIEEQAAAGDEKTRLSIEADRLRTEISALKASDAYKAGTELNDLREHLATLVGLHDEATEQIDVWTSRAKGDREAVAQAGQEVTDRVGRLGESLDQTARLASSTGLATRPPGVPAVPTTRASEDEPAEPVGPLETQAAEEQLASLRRGASERVHDLESMTQSIDAVDAAQQTLANREEARNRAAGAVELAESFLGEARANLTSALDTWRESATHWLERITRHREEHGLAPAPTDLLHTDPLSAIADGVSLLAPFRAIAEDTTGSHQHRFAQLDATIERHDERLAELRSRVDELAAIELPAPPSQPWQAGQRTNCLSELVDFADHVDDAQRAGLEAALEAAGLLGAEIRPDGTAVLTDGQLAVGPGDAAPGRSLAELLQVSLPHDHRGVDRQTVEGVLHAVSIDLADDHHTAVTTTGSFRIGSLTGQHSKNRAEHIGTTARRAALERQKAEAASAVSEAENERAVVADQRDARQRALEDARALADTIPTDTDLRIAASNRDAAAARHDEASVELSEREAELRTAEAQLDANLAYQQRLATRLSLPTSRDALKATAGDLAAITNLAESAADQFREVRGAVRRWSEAGSAWRQTGAHLTTAAAHRDKLAVQVREQATKLATLEDSVGLDYEEITATLETSNADLDQALGDLDRVEKRHEAALVAATQAEERRANSHAARREADERCLHLLPHLRATILVPGLVDAATGADLADTADPDDGADASDFPTVEDSPDGARQLGEAVLAMVPSPDGETTADGVRISLRRRRDTLGAGWDAEDLQPDDTLPLRIEVTGPQAAQAPLSAACRAVRTQHHQLASLLTVKQQQALRNLLQGLVAREIADKLHAAGELIDRMNQRLAEITTAHGIGVTLRWTQRDDLDPDLAETVALLAKLPDLRTPDEDQLLSTALGQRIEEARREEPDLPYRDLIAAVLDYRSWFRMSLILHRPGRADEKLNRRTTLSEGEKKIVTYLPLFAAVAASCDVLAAAAPEAPRFVLLDDAFAKVSEDNHPKLFGLLVELDLDFIATSERLWGTHDTVPELAITEVIRDADLATIVLEHSRWDGRTLEAR